LPFQGKPNIIWALEFKDGNGTDASMKTAMPVEQLYERAAMALERGERLAVATVVDTIGSTPQRAGAKLIVLEDGQMVGTVGGGCVEAEVWAQAREVLRSDRPGLCTFHLSDDPERDDGMVCGGTMNIFIDLWRPGT
jgi:xanthine dehydrogenase accessory factor